ncbi:hypothetical protein ILYODFUR_029646 [Ilyodon furcidens]|uniref:Uncharacterized protein n=1 Tax=Ilyodon furcidens TaxID=33524 RepID=A0ABV0UXJ5_9TELE
MNPVHPPPSTAPTSETPGPTNHPGTPLSTITSLTGKQPLGLSAPPSGGSLHQSSKAELLFISFDPELSLLTILFIFTVGIPVPVPCSLHCSVNKHFTVKLCLLDCFLHVVQIC